LTGPDTPLARRKISCTCEQARGKVVILLSKGLADDCLEPLWFRAPEVAQVDLVVLAPQLPTTLLYTAVDPLYGRSLFGEGAKVHDLR
jgi:hypothetical protein